MEEIRELFQQAEKILIFTSMKKKQLFVNNSTLGSAAFYCTFYAVGSVKKSSSKQKTFLETKHYAIMISSDDIQKATSPHVLGRIFLTTTGFRNATRQKSP